MVLQFDPRLGVTGYIGVEYGTNRNVFLTLLLDIYTHNRSILHRLATIHNAADRAIGMRRRCLKTCYSAFLLKVQKVCAILTIAIIYTQTISCRDIWHRKQRSLHWPCRHLHFVVSKHTLHAIHSRNIDVVAFLFAYDIFRRFV